jgi:hypothetical protein
MALTKHKNLVIITEIYPFKGGEQFLYNEFNELSKKYKNIFIFPLTKKEEFVEGIPENIIINTVLSESPKLEIFTLIKNFRFVSLLVFMEIFFGKNSRFFLYKIKYNLATIKQCLLIQSSFKN